MAKTGDFKGMLNRMLERNETCGWIKSHRLQDKDPIWHTQCGNKFVFQDGIEPGRVNIKWCLFCGGEISIGMPEEVPVPPVGSTCTVNTSLFREEGFPGGCKVEVLAHKESDCGKLVCVVWNDTTKEAIPLIPSSLTMFSDQCARCKGSGIVRIGADDNGIVHKMKCSTCSGKGSLRQLKV